MDEQARDSGRVRNEVLRAKEQTYFYPRGKGELKFNDNTSPYGPSPAVRELMGRSICEVIGGVEESTFYPDQNADALRSAVAAVEGIEPDCIVTGTGADELLDILFRALVDKGEIVTIPVPAYFMYEHLASLNSATIRTPHMGRPPRLPDGADSKSKMYIFSNPHNPTGSLFTREEIVRLVDSFKGMVVVDEAYAEYADSTVVPLIRNHPNLVVVRTFSKIHGLPNFRIGYCIASVEIALQLRKVKNPFNLTTVSQKLATAAVQDRGYVASIRSTNALERRRMSKALESLGFHVFSSSANFILIDLGDRCNSIFSALIRKGVYTKRVNDAGYENCIRVTVRSKEENDEMLLRLSDIVLDLP